MKILQVIYSLSSGGGERFVVDLSNQLARNPENEVIIVIIMDLNVPRHAHYRQDIASNIKVINLGCHKGMSIKSLWRLTNTIRKEKPDIVHCHSNLVLIYPAITLLPNVKYVHTLHNLAEKCLTHKKMKGIQSWLYRNKVKAVTISNECHSSFIKLYDNDCATEICNGREKIATTQSYEDVANEIRKIVKPNMPLFINVARGDKQKNHPMLFEVFERLASEETNCQLIVLGAHHEKNAEKYKNHPTIHIIGERRNVADYLACANFFILSSSFEGLPLTLLEAMSMGCIPVCTPAGGIKNVIRNGENGFLTDGFETDNLYNSVRQALDQAYKINRNSIIKEFEEKYSMKTCADKYYQLYKKTLI